jgi:hypothetical protein
VIDLLYPTAKSADDEALIKHRLSAQVMSAARMKQFNVLALDEQETIKVDEIMVGCARVEDTAPVIGPGAKVGSNEPAKDPNVYGDEDGETWFASGHLGVDYMITVVRQWEAEVAEPIPEDEIDRLTHSTYYVVLDPENEERLKLVDHDFPGAEPMTSIRRR